MTQPDRPRTDQRRNILITVLILGVVVLAVFVAAILRTALTGPDLSEALDARDVLYFDSPRPLPEVDLVTEDGDPFTTADFAGQWHLVYFGYTFCPDVCPTRLADLARAYEQLAGAGLADRLQVWLVTVDPERDTPERLDDYLAAFHADFAGLTGDENQALQPLARQLNSVFYREGEGDDYSVAHSDNLAVINPRGDYVALLRPPHDAGEIAEVLALLLENPR